MIYKNLNLLDLLAVLIVVVVSMSLHEFAHAFIAYKNGDYTAKASGRMTLNPVKHFDIIGFALLMTVGFGFAKPVPVNPNNFKHLKRGIFTVAIAGVTVNLILAFIFSPLYIISIGKITATTSFSKTLLEFFQLLFAYFIIINVSLAIFNLLPLYPLDGFRVLSSFTRITNKVTKFLRDFGMYILIFLFFLHFLITRFNSVGILKYFDLFGLYMDYVGGGISNLMLKFWGLFIK